MTRFRIPDPAMVPEELQAVTLTMSYEVWDEFVHALPAEWSDQICQSKCKCDYPIKLGAAPDEAKIRAALDQPCEECGGMTWVVSKENRPVDGLVCRGSPACARSWACNELRRMNENLDT